MQVLLEDWSYKRLHKHGLAGIFFFLMLFIFFYSKKKFYWGMIDIQTYVMYLTY